MKNYTLGNLVIPMPENWSELTLGQFLNLCKLEESLTTINEFDLVERLSIVSGVDYVTLNNTNGDTVEQTAEFFQSLRWMQESFPKQNAETRPDKVTIAGKEVVIPEDIKYETRGQYENFIAIVLSKTRVLNDGSYMCDVEVYDAAIAIYITPLVYGKAYSPQNKREVLQEVRKLRLYEAQAVASFFLNKFMLSIPKELNTSIKGQATKTFKSKQGLKKSIKTSKH
jgi:hypothetical protein